MKEIGVGVIALGWMGRLHSRGFSQVAQRYPELGVKARLVAATVQANQEAALALGFERAVADYREVLDDPQIEAVSICAPNFLHHEIAMAAIAAGKHFWIEKPMGVNAAQSREIAQAAAAAGLVTAAGFNYRHQPAVEHARDLVRTGRLGRVTNARVWLIADYASSPEGAFTWRYTRAQAGAGVVGDLLSHGIDLAQYVLGSRIAEVSAMTDTHQLPSRAAGRGYRARSSRTQRRAASGGERGLCRCARTDAGSLVTLDVQVAMGPRAVRHRGLRHRRLSALELQARAPAGADRLGRKPPRLHVGDEPGQLRRLRTLPARASTSASTTARWSRLASS